VKIIHLNGISREELLSYRSIIYKNALDSDRTTLWLYEQSALTASCQKTGYVLFLVLGWRSSRLLILCSPTPPKKKANVEAIYEYRLEHTPNFVFSEAIASAVKQLWQKTIIPTLMDYSGEFYLGQRRIMSNHHYHHPQRGSVLRLFEEAMRIGGQNWKRTCCVCGPRAQGTCFNTGQLS